MNATHLGTENIDVTVIKNNTLSEIWKCPHCQNTNKIGMYAHDIFAMYGKYIEHCPRCGYLHLFRLNLIRNLRKKVVDFLKKYSGA